MNGSKYAKYYHLAENRFFRVMKRLREMNLLKKEDIREHGLLLSSAFHVKKFRYLAEWDPAALTHPCNTLAKWKEMLPLHCATQSSSLQGFRVVFATGMSYFPRQKGIGLLFRKNARGMSPFQMACTRHGTEKVMEAVETVLADSSNNPYNTEHALISATVDDCIDLDGGYFLLRREPDVLQKILSVSTVEVRNSKKNKRNDGSDNSVAMIEARKRKKRRTKCSDR